MRLLDRMMFLSAVVVAACGPADPAEVATVSSPVLATLPAAPTELTARLAKGNVVRLTWADHATNESGFAIDRRRELTELEGVVAFWSRIGIVGPDATTFADDHVLGGAVYTYRVAAFNGVGYSGWSNLATVQLPGGTAPPAAPTGLTARLDLDGVHLGWTDHSDGQAAFELERSVVEGRWLGIGVTAQGATTFVASPVLAGEASFRVRAFNAAGASEWSNLAGAVLPKHEQGLPPAAPTDLALKVIGSTTRLTWHDNSTNETGFEVERLTLSYYQPIWEPIGVTERDATMFIDEARPAGTLAYRVRAINPAGDSAWVTQLIAFSM